MKQSLAAVSHTRWNKSAVSAQSYTTRVSFTLPTSVRQSPWSKINWYKRRVFTPLARVRRVLKRRPAPCCSSEQRVAELRGENIALRWGCWAAVLPWGTAYLTADAVFLCKYCGECGGESGSPPGLQSFLLLWVALGARVCCFNPWSSAWRIIGYMRVLTFCCI